MAAPQLHLVMHYCNHALPEREAEYQYCLRKNLNHPFVVSVHNLVDPQTCVPEEFTSHPKHIEVNHPGQWISYRDVFNYANENLAGKTVCTMNLDTFLDDTQSSWGEISALMDGNIVLCLSRTEFDPSGPPYKDPMFARVAFANSQDAWIFRAPFDVPDCDFHIGTLGCDNAIAERIKRTGRIPVNSPNKFRVMHYDRARGKIPTNQKKVHGAERERGGQQNLYPEEQGHYLLPDFDQIASLDKLLDSMNATPIQRYQFICDIMSKFLSIRNR